MSKAQTHIAHYIYPDRIKQDTLLDTLKGIKYIVEKNRIYIKAIDKNGKQLWRTDPATDSKLEEYRVKRPTLVYFKFVYSNIHGEDPIIEIAYNNSQYGYIDEKKGNLLSWRKNEKDSTLNICAHNKQF